MLAPKKEALVGLTVIVLFMSFVIYVINPFTIFFACVTTALAYLSVHFFSKKSMVSKGIGVFMFHEVILKLLMPSKYRKQLKELEKRERGDS